MPAKKSAIDVALIRELADLLNDSELNEVEIMEGELSIRLVKGASGPMAYPAAAPAMAAPAPAPAVAPIAVTEAPSAPTANSGDAVPSPMVGTAFLSPAPGAEPFVKVGQKVKKGQTVLIVEAMKTMNQIPSPKDGTVKEICVEDAQPVEYGEALIIIE